MVTVLEGRGSGLNEPGIVCGFDDKAMGGDRCMADAVPGESLSKVDDSCSRS